MRRSQHSARATAPPRQYPRISAIVGLSRFSSLAHTAASRALAARTAAASACRRSNSEMSAGAEGFAAGPRYDNDADGAILCQIVEDLVETIPHRDRNCIEPRRIIEDDADNRSFLAQNNLV